MYTNLGTKETKTKLYEKKQMSWRRGFDTSMFGAALVTTANTQEQPKRLCTDD